MQETQEQGSEFGQHAKKLAKEALLAAAYIPKIFCNCYHHLQKHSGAGKYRTLEETADEALQKTRSQKLNLVCHSQGGLLGLLYVMEAPEKVSSYTTFGTPFKGTPAAYLSPLLLLLGLMPTSTMQLMPDSRFTRALREYFRQNNSEFEKQGIQFRNIRALYDEFVPYHSSALKELLPTAGNIAEHTLKEGHLTVLHNKTSLEIIEDVLRKREPVIFIPGFVLNKGLFENLTKNMCYEKEITYFLHYDYTHQLQMKTRCDKK